MDCLEINKNMTQDIQNIKLSLFGNSGMDQLSLYGVDQKSFQRTSDLYTAFADKEQKKNEETPYKRFRGILQEFGQNTSFHGLKFVTESNTFFLKRLIWLLVMLTCAGLLIWQMVDRVVYFYGWPVTVNVRINYNKSLVFPLVTICNQNAFKTTLAGETKRYKLLEQMFTQRETFNYESLARFGADNMTLFDMYNKTAHTKEDFIFRCTWKGEPCRADDFETVFTDHGVCYTFNRQITDEFVSSPGAENGLRLALNVEQYEYMPGPHDSAGVKMLLHGPGELPRVHALGQAIPSGAHVVVGVKVFLVNNLGHPYGKCKDKQLQYVDQYSVEACELDCLTRFAKEKCGCRNLYMPHRNGDPAICTLKQYYLCLRDTEKTFIHTKDTICDCPEPCNYKLYDPDISYASTSQYAIDTFLSSKDKLSLSKSLIRAKEVSSKLNDKIFENTKKISHNLEESVEHMEDLLVNNLSYAVNTLNDLLNNMTTKFENDYLMKEFLYRFQIYIVKKNFIRARDAMEERTVHIIALAYLEYIFSIEKKIRLLADLNFTDASGRLIMYQSAREMLDNRQTIVRMAYDNYTTLIDAYDTGKGIFNYSFEGLSRKYNAPATPKLLLLEARVHNNYARKYGERYGRYLNSTIGVLDWLKEVLETSFLNSSLDEDRLFYCIDTFRWYMRNTLFAKSVFYAETIEWPIGILQGKLDTFTAKWNEYSSLSKNIQQNLKSLKLQVDGVDDHLLRPLHDIHDTFRDYIHGELFSKFNVSQIMTSLTIQNGILDFQTFFQQIRTRESYILDSLSRMQSDIRAIIGDIYDDIDAVEYYNYTEKNEFLRNFTDVIEEITENFTKLEKLSHFSRLINNSDSAFMKALDDVITDSKDFLNSVQIDSAFLRENFLKLDIFFRQMSYEEIQQQIAYDTFALVCDIGGSMGLFLGASLLSIFEILDLIFSQFIMKQKNSKPKRLTQVNNVSIK